MRDCAPRYEALKELFSSYERRFSLFDFGANRGYFGARALEDFDASVFLLDKDPLLLEVGPARAAKAVYDANSTILRQLLRGEHFDVTLALSVLHHLYDWRSMLDALWWAGDWLVVEYPGREDRGIKGEGRLVQEQFDELERRGGELLGEFPGLNGLGTRRMRLYFTGKSTVSNDAFWSRRVWLSAPPAPKHHHVYSSPWAKRIIKDAPRDWVHGVNLWSYYCVGGRVSELTLPPPDGHGDYKPWNMVLDNGAVHMVDREDPKDAYGCGPEEVQRWLVEGGALA